MELCFVSVTPKYANLPYFEIMYWLPLMLWFCPAFWSRDMTRYLVFSTFTYRQIPLVATNKASVFVRTVCRVNCFSRHNSPIQAQAASFFMFLDHTQSVCLWTRRRLAAEAASCTTHNTQEKNIHALSGIRARDPNSPSGCRPMPQNPPSHSPIN
jgi:hypothetical protein